MENKQFHPRDILPFRNVSVRANTCPDFAFLPDDKYRIRLLSRDGAFTIMGIGDWYTENQTQLLCGLVNGKLTRLQVIMSGEFPADFFDDEDNERFYMTYWKEVVKESKDGVVRYGLSLAADLRYSGKEKTEVCRWIACQLNGTDYDLLDAEAYLDEAEEESPDDALLPIDKDSAELYGEAEEFNDCPF